MKLRARGNSIRLRLAISEIEQLATRGRVEEELHFGASDKNVLTYCLVTESDLNELEVSFSGLAIVVKMPKAWAVTWSESEVVGFSATIGVGNGNTLDVAVEKDFKRLTNKGRDEAPDAFPHPRRKERGG